MRSILAAIAALAFFALLGVMRGFGSPLFDILVAGVAIACFAFASHSQSWTATAGAFFKVRPWRPLLIVIIVIASQARFLSAGEWQVVWLMPLAVFFGASFWAISARFASDSGES
jgi:hypothetical protein